MATLTDGYLVKVSGAVVGGQQTMVDAAIETSYFRVDGSRAMTGNLDLDGHAIVNVTDLTATGTVTLTDATVALPAGGVDLASLDIDGGADIGAALADADLLVVDDGAGGTNRKSAVSRVWDYTVLKIQSLNTKVTPVDADILTIQDSADSNTLKELTIANLWDNRLLTDAKAIRLDEFTATNDTTDLDSSTGSHGLMPKLSGTATEAILGDGSWGNPLPASHADTHVSGGSDSIKLDDLAAPDDNTDLNVSTSAHGLMSKLPDNAAVYYNGVGGWTTPAGGHDRQHAMTDTSDHTAGNWKLFHSNGSGEVVELSLGAASAPLLGGGASSAPAFGSLLFQS
jgi:hypothetical protein